MAGRVFFFLAALLAATPTHAKGEKEVKNWSEHHMQGWSESCGFADDSTCNEWQKGFLGFERHHFLKQAKSEVENWHRQLKKDKFPDEHEKIRTAWSARVVEEIVSDIEKNGEKPKKTEL